MNENNNIKLRVPILILSRLGLAAGLSFYTYDYFMNHAAFLSIDRILMLIPVILLVIFVLLSRQKCKSALLASVFIATAAINIWDIFRDFIYSLVLSNWRIIKIPNLIYNLIHISICVLLFINILKGIANKSLFAVFICVLAQYNQYTGFWSRFYDWGLIFFSSLFTLLPLLAILLFGLNNTLIPIIEPMTKDSNAESALKALKDAFTAGIISEEEYSRKRSEIISKL